LEDAKMKGTRKTAPVKVKLPVRGTSAPSAAGPLFTILNPGGGEVYKLYAQYHTKPQLGPCKFRIFWKDGPYPANNLTISLIDIKNWVVAVTIATNVANVPAGQVGMFQWTMPANFLASDDCPGTSTYPLKYGRYQIYIQGGAPLTWTYGPEFTIAWV
jgi:hypothetical protein